MTGPLQHEPGLPVDALAGRLARCSTSAARDLLRMMGHDSMVLPPAIRTFAARDCLPSDRDGVVIIPQALAAEVIAKAEEVVATQSEMRRAFVGGMDPLDAYHRHGRF